MSPGLGRGKAYVHKDALQRGDGFYEIDEAQAADEVARFRKAVEHVAGKLEGMESEVRTEIDDGLSEVFVAHAQMIGDASLKEEVERAIREELVSAAAAVKIVFRRWEHRFKSMDSDVARQKSEDVRDLARQLVASLAGVRQHEFEDLPEGCILVAKRLLPSDTLYLSRKNTAGVVLEEGGVGSHAALFACEIGLPGVAQIENATQTIKPGEQLLVDADQAEVVVNPSERDVERFVQRERNQEKARSEALRNAFEPAVTSGGQQVNVYANIGDADDALAAFERGAEGVGLYRIEQVYLGKETPPDAETLAEEISNALKPADGHPVYVRLLDVGADKALPFMDKLREGNPALGLRGIRFLAHHPELLDTQLRTLLKLSTEVDLHILVPMVTLPADVALVNERLKKLAADGGVGKVPPVGAMIETPAAALAAGVLAEQVDFLSFGTNDLTQYAFAADRENAAVDDYFDDTHDAVFRMLELVHNDLPDMPLSVCGELAGRPEAVARLLACGITTLSVAPPLVAETKQAVRQA